jgi:hypothetical protein
MDARTHAVVLSFSLPRFQSGASVGVRSVCSSLLVETQQAVGELLDDHLAAQLHTRDKSHSELGKHPFG